MKTKFNFIKITLTLFGFFLAFVALYQLYNYLYKAPGTEFAIQIECEDKITVKGYFVRDEQVINSSGAKYYDVIIPNGGKISSGGTIANVYSSDNAASIQSEIRDLQLKIDEFKAIIETASKYQQDISYSSEIKKNAISITYHASDNNPDEAFHSASEFITSITKSKIAAGEITDYGTKINDLEKQMDTLKSQTSAVIKYVYAPVSGYFSYKVDGVEDKFGLSYVDQITPEIFNDISSTYQNLSSSSNAIGKVVKGSDWRVCFKAEAAKFENVNIGSILYIRIPSVTESKIKCEVVSVYEQNDEIYVVLESNMVTGDLISQRVSDIDIIITSYSGLRIDKNAIRKIDGKDGVFVKTNGVLRYREVEIMYFSTSFVVIKYDPFNSKGVQAFDEVIIRGSGLYDGKVIT